ncbi:flagellar basal body rod C-terminal domain-containing protein [Sphingomonas sp. TREG-RG-20F-R18-01]|uniref:FlgK family flagellar hook-associated protein n=1 Tax=Sphingomonas sp. TREG-RG-20F-R18-01 TaxID=2914982 RepID=UPI001F58C63E|nr:flagellar basal body rod C-terminal domain-containing protein [Sphingomonas sp. TREG-RG-20F-R18-01]
MALSDILGSAMSGLNAAQAGLRVVSTNIANVGTTGYAREQLNISTNVVGGRVAGVLVGESTRVADRFLEAASYSRAGDVGSATTTSTYLDRLQALLGAPGAESSLTTQLDAISSAGVTLTGSLATPQNADAFIAKTADAIGSLQQVDRDAAALSADADAAIGDTVSRANALLSQISVLNDAVSRLDGLGRSSAGVADQRMLAIQDLSGLIGVTVRDQPDGRVTIETAGGAPLLDQRLRLLSYPNGGGAAGAAQPSYPGIDIRFADSAGLPGVATGDRIDNAGVGGKLGALLDLRDRTIPGFRDQLGSLFGGLSQSLNAASNAATAVPPPAQLVGANTPLAASDRLGFTGKATIAVTSAAGKLVASTTLDFTAMGPQATVGDMVAAINTGLAGAATASFSDGRLTLSATAAGNGVAIGQDPTTPALRAGSGLSQVFGMNDLIRSNGATIPSGFCASDPHGFAPGGTAQLALRDGSGRLLGQYTLTPRAGGTFGEIISDLNASPLGHFGSFAIDPSGRVRFTAGATVGGATLSIPGDSTDRAGTGCSFTMIAGLTGGASGLATAEIRPDIQGNGGRLPLARLDTLAIPGGIALNSTDTSGAAGYADAQTKTLDLGVAGTLSTRTLAARVLGGAGSSSALAKTRLADATARRDDAVNRRDSFSGVNIDEELSQMVVLQNSYSAAARVITTVNTMYDTLLTMVR